VTGLLDALLELRLLVVTGKGGVGKSTVTAALGRLLQARGRRVLLVEADPRENLHQLLDVQPSGGELLRVAPGLFLQHLDPRTLLDDLVREKLKVGVLVNRVLHSPIHQHFAEGAPGLKETAVFGRILRYLTGHGPRLLPRPDVVILDAPASGHGLQWLAAPQLVADVVASGPVGHMASEIADLLGDPHQCGVLVVTLAEEMPVQEAIELIEQLDHRFGRRPEAMVVNSLYPAAPSASVVADRAAELWLRRRRVNDRELGRLGACWDGPLLELPLLPIDPGPALVGALGAHLERELRRP
jgi:anion-transporting  ArsA/GET3 family ATPase